MRYTNITDKEVVTTTTDEATTVTRTPPVAISGQNTTIADDSPPPGDEAPTDPPLELAAPTNLAVESLTPRISADGSLVVDAVISFDEVPHATEYEVRLTKK